MTSNLLINKTETRLQLVFSHNFSIPLTFTCVLHNSLQLTTIVSPIFIGLSWSRDALLFIDGEIEDITWPRGDKFIFEC